MAQYELSIRYAGEALESGRMPIKDLAPALLAISGALQEIQRIKDPHLPPIAIDIKATQKGSFIIDLILANGPDTFEKIVNLFTSQPADAILNLAAYASLLIAMCKIIKSKSKREEKLCDGQIKITLDNNETITLSNNDLQIYRSIEFRTQIKNVVAPLASDGIDTFSITSERTETVRISKNDISAFVVPEVRDETLEPIISEIYLQLINVAFEHGKWKFSDGTNSFFATIEDGVFIDKVKKAKIKFTTNDRIKVKLRTMQKVTTTGLKTEFAIEKVLKHIPGAVQLELDFDEDNNATPKG